MKFMNFELGGKVFEGVMLEVGFFVFLVVVVVVGGFSFWKCL